MFAFGDLIIFGETWLSNEANIPTLENFGVHFNNVGRGKGLAMFYKKDKVTVEDIYTDDLLQMSIARTEKLDIIGFYRSSEDKSFISALEKWIYPKKSYVLIGDMNICSRTSSGHKILETLSKIGFNLITKEPTHIQGGYIDQAWLKLNAEEFIEYEHSIYSPFYNCTDHDAILITIKSNISDESNGNKLCLYE